MDGTPNHQTWPTDIFVSWVLVRKFDCGTGPSHPQIGRKGRDTDSTVNAFQFLTIIFCCCISFFFWIYFYIFFSGFSAPQELRTFQFLNLRQQDADVGDRVP
jgi:hypothetical protein